MSPQMFTHYTYEVVPNMHADKKWLSIAEAARYIGMSVGFVRKAVRLQNIPYTRIGSKTLRFDRDALDVWLLAQSCAGEVNHAGHQ